MPKVSRINNKLIIISCLLIIIATILDGCIPFFQMHNLILFIPICFVPWLDNEYDENNILTLLIIVMIYLIFNPVNMLLQIWIMIFSVLLYQTIHIRELTDTKLMKFAMLITGSFIFVIVYTLLTCLVNGQNFTINLVQITNILYNALCLLVLYYIADFIKFKNSTRK